MALTGYQRSATGVFGLSARICCRDYELVLSGVLAQNQIRLIVRCCAWHKEQLEIVEIELVRCRAVPGGIDLMSPKKQLQSLHQDPP